MITDLINLKPTNERQDRVETTQPTPHRAVTPHRDFSKHAIRSVVMNIINDENTMPIPAFSATVLKLRALLEQQDVDINLVIELIKLDPGLTSQYLQLAPVSKSGKKSTADIKTALIQAGIGQVRKQATALGVLDRVSHLRIKIDWNMFWLHNVLTARLTERIASAYRPITGKEYLAGLLHDVGKVFLEHYFPQDFEAVVQHAMERKCGMLEAEQKLLDITHSEISAALCERWGLHREIVRAVRFHHDPDSPFNKDPIEPENEKFLAACVAVADLVADICKADISGAKDMTGIALESTPEWLFLKKFTPKTGLDLDVEVELQKARESIEAAMSYSLPQN